MSSGTTNNRESYTFTPASARFVRVTVNGNTINDWGSITELQVTAASTAGGTGSSSGGTGGSSGASAYDQVVLADGPVAMWDMAARAGTEPDITGKGHTGTYKSGIPAAATLPNGAPK
jgi:hypothetical protein